MHFVYQFPLFTAFLRGNMSPLKPENAAESNFKLRLQEQLTSSASDEGLYALRFLKSLHPKQEYYRRALLSPAEENQLLLQVCRFSQLYWKSVSRQWLPVTLRYPEMLAQIAPHFRYGDIPEEGRESLWFL
jgi:hypothetical protein